MHVARSNNLENLMRDCDVIFGVFSVFFCFVLFDEKQKNKNCIKNEFIFTNGEHVGFSKENNVEDCSKKCQSTDSCTSFSYGKIQLKIR